MLTSHRIPACPSISPLTLSGALFISLLSLLLVPCVRARAQRSAPPAVVIDSSVTVVENPHSAAPVNRATQDLLSDMTKVFGRTPKVANTLDTSGAIAILIAQNAEIPAGVHCATATDAEAFAFSITAGNAKTRQVVCLTGTDMRGTIYAVYEFSQRYLGVDPMYLWTDRQPEKRLSITLPADFTHTFSKPLFKYRGFFPNDEDLLTGWVQPAKGQQTGIALSTWDMVYETTLRLKGNMVVPGTWIFPDDAQVHAATERGLIINQHHAIPLGVNVARWPRDVPYNLSTHPEILERAWTNAVATYKPDEEILWSVGLRGLSDSSYASLDPSVQNNDPLLGQRVSEAITTQMKIVRARYPNAQFVTDLWQEGARLMQNGYLKIPPEVSLVWADTGYGDMQDGGKVSAGQGAYFHVAMMNSQANQLSEMVPVAVIQSELGRYIKAGATSYILVNTSDLRPVAMTMRAVMEAAWGGIPGGPDPSDAYYRKWSTEEFGPRAADAVTAVYKEYFAAPSPRASFGPPPGSRPAGASAYTPPPRLSDVTLEEGDQHYHTEIRRAILDDLSQHQVINVPSQSPKWTQPRVGLSMTAQQGRAALDRDIQECESAQPRWDAVWQHALAAQPLVDPTRQNFYQAAVLTMITINRESNRALLLVARGMEHAQDGQGDQARGDIAQALESLGAVQASMSKAEYGKWKNWYRGDWLTGVYRTRELVQAYANHLADPMAKLPPPVGWTGWEAYFHIMAYEGDRSVDVH
jgi:hypothetical protein